MESLTLLNKTSLFIHPQSLHPTFAHLQQAKDSNLSAADYDVGEDGQQERMVEIRSAGRRGWDSCLFWVVVAYRPHSEFGITNSEDAFTNIFSILSTTETSSTMFPVFQPIKYLCQAREPASQTHISHSNVALSTFLF